MHPPGTTGLVLSNEELVVVTWIPEVVAWVPPDVVVRRIDKVVLCRSWEVVG